MNTSTPELSIVDKIVKRIILTSFSSYPSRAHALSHVLLTTGNCYEWVKGADGLYVLESPFDDADDTTTRIEPEEHEELDGAYKLLARFKDSNASITFRNMITEWISDNIDVYCTRRFQAELGADLSPTQAYTNFMTNSAAISTMPNVEEIHPAWVSAIEELISNQFDLIWAGGLPRGSRDALEHVRQYDPAYASLYLALMNAREKIEAAKPVKNNPYTQKLVEQREQRLADKYAQLTAKAEKAAWEAPSFEEFVKISTTDFKKGNIIIHEELVSFVAGRQEDMHRFFPNGKPNADFERQAMAVIESCTAFNRYPQVATLVDYVKRDLGIRTACEPLVEVYVNDVLPMLFTAS